MNSVTQAKSIHLKTTPENHALLKSLADQNHLTLSQYLIDSGLNNTVTNPLCTKQVHEFMLHLESFQKMLEKQAYADHNIDRSRNELYQEAKKLWQSLSI